MPDTDRSAPAPTTDKPEGQARAESAPLLRPVNLAERGLEGVGDRLWGTFRKRPYIGAVLAGGIGLGLASAVGVAELAVAVGTGYAAYLVLKNKVSPAQAVRDAFRFEEDVGK
jgi:hypothetical protein